MSDISYILIWWLIFFSVGIINLPLTFHIFGNFYDKGYAFAKTIGFLLLTYLFMVFSTIKLLPFTILSLTFLLVAIAGINLMLFRKNPEKFETSIRKALPAILIEEILFFLGLISWSLVRGYFPDINGLEKFMDFGFINSMLKGRFLPPNDMWFAGKFINYYWFGHLWTAVATKLSLIPSGVTYNLMIATIFGLGLSSAFSISSNLFFKLSEGKSKKLSYIAGVISAVTLVLAGNFHTPFYVLKNGKATYWYPDATRFIGYNPDTNDKTIHEFPQYSFVVSDLHAHLLNFPFTLLFMALLLSFVFFVYGHGSETSDAVVGKSRAKKINNKSVLTLNDLRMRILYLIRYWMFDTGHFPKLMPLGIVMGIMFMTNTWDFGNYLILSGVTFLVVNLARKGIGLDFIYQTAAEVVILITTGLIIASPFIYNFVSIAQGIAFVHAHSPLWQLAILWGFPFVLTVIFLLSVLKEGLSKFKTRPGDLFVLSIFICTWILIILPEIIYVKDIYIATHHRANTMFKLTYQSFVMSYMVSGYVAIRIIYLSKNIFKKIILMLFFTFLFWLVLIYPTFAIKSYYRDLASYQGLDGETWLSQMNPDEYSVLLWFRKYAGDSDVMLEAPGDSYTEKDVISSYSGVPTVSGWFVHEWLWRGAPEFPQERVNDIEIIYTTSDAEVAKSYLNKYKVNYVIVGPNEYEKFPNLSEDKFNLLGSVVFITPTIKVYKIKS